MESSIDKVQIARLQKDFNANVENGKAVGGRFFIPKYQRGYRWTPLQVEQLLDDIDEFSYTEGSENYYCLQPVVVQKDSDRDRWIVVDGQQRLTTIFIVLSCLRCIEERKKKPFYELEYESKPELWDCLKSLGDETDIELDLSDIDKYHMTNAYRTVREWVRKQKDKKSADEEILATKLGTKIKEGVCFIWYEVPSSVEPETTFTRINMGKIPLTNAELIKALILKKDNFFDKHDFKGDIKGEQARISMAWDLMETSLHKRDFWLFLTNDKDEEQDVRIEMVFDIMARHFLQNDEEFEHLRDTNPSTYLFLILSKKHEQMTAAAKEYAKAYNEEYIYGNVLNDFWQEVNRFYQMLQDWYEKREWYHLIGYLVAAKELGSKKIDVGKTLYELSKTYKDKSKSVFTKTLKGMVLREVMGIREDTNEDGLDNLTYKEIKESFYEPKYNGGYAARIRIHKLLLLFNVITVQTSEDKFRFPFHAYKKTKWNLEHIHSVTTKLPSNNKECEEWAAAVKKYLDSVDYFKDDENKNISQRLGEMKTFDKTSDEFKDLYKDVSESFSRGRLSDDHLENGIMNMALLDEQTNKAYKNVIFPMKRKYIMDKMGRDNFVPICTKNVFLKYYTREVTQFYIWDESDRLNYFEKLCTAIYEYLTDKKAVVEQSSEEV